MRVEFKGAGKRIEDIDLPRVGALIGVGEDPVHALLEVESTGSGFDRLGRVKALFEPHHMWKHTSGAKRDAASAAGLAYPKWGTQKYPADSYPRIEAAMKIAPRAALMSVSWGLGQIMGSNYALAGYDSPEAMVSAFADDEDKQLEAIISFVKKSGIDDDLRRIDAINKSGRTPTAADFAPIARVYNGAGYATHNYHGRLAAANARWLRIKNTPYAPADVRIAAQAEQRAHEAGLIKQVPGDAAPLPPAKVPPGPLQEVKTGGRVVGPLTAVAVVAAWFQDHWPYIIGGAILLVAAYYGGKAIVRYVRRRLSGELKSPLPDWANVLHITSIYGRGPNALAAGEIADNETEGTSWTGVESEASSPQRLHASEPSSEDPLARSLARSRVQFLAESSALDPTLDPSSPPSGRIQKPAASSRLRTKPAARR